MSSPQVTGYSFQPIEVPGGMVPDIRWLRRSSGSTFPAGSPVIYSAGEIIVAGADPTLVVGVALQDAVSGSGTYLSDNVPTTDVTGFEQKISVAIANRTTVFGAQLTNNSDVVIAPVQADIGVSYGITLHADGTWTVDKNKTGGSARVQVIGIDTTANNPGIVKFKWLESAMTPNP